MIDEVKLRLRKRHLPASQTACDHSHDATTRDHRCYHRLLDHPRPHRSGTAEKTRVVVVTGCLLRVVVVAGACGGGWIVVGAEVDSTFLESSGPAGTMARGTTL
jgi:hypothetical protein